MNALAFTPTLRARLAALGPRERIFLGAGAASTLLFGLYWMPSSPADEAGVVLASPPPPMSLAASPPAAAAPAAPAVPAPSVEGLLLQGVMGGGRSGGSAIILFPNGQPRSVRIGRELMPGLMLKSIGVSHAIVAGAAGEWRLGLGKSGAVAAPAAASAAAPAGYSPATAATPAVQRRETLQYRLGLEPRKANGRIAGFALRPGATLPALQKAGLQPGDVLVAVNGQAFESEEKVLELPKEIAGSFTAEFEYIRGGKRMKAALEVNPRP